MAIELKRRLSATSGRGRKVKRTLSLLRPYRGRLTLMLLALLFGTAAQLAPAPLAKLAIDQGIIPGDIGRLNLIVAAFILSALVLWLATYLQTYLVGWIGQRVLQDLRVTIFRHLQRMSVGFYEQRRAGLIISRLTNDVQALDQLVTDGIVTLIQSTLLLLGTVLILLWLDLQLALITFLIFPLMLIGSFVFRIASADAYRATREKIGWITAYLQESVSGVRVVRAFAQEQRHRERFAKFNREYQQANMKTVYLNASYFPTVELISAGLMVVILIVGGFEVIEGALTVGVLVAFITALNNFFDPIQQLSQLYTTYQSGMAALDKIFELLDEEPQPLEIAGGKQLDALAGRIEFKSAGFSYLPDGQSVISDLDLTVEAGQTVALVGPTGAGKSTLIKLVARFYDVTAGEVSIDGHNLRDLDARSLRSHMGIVPQEGFLFSGTIAQNIAFGRPDASDQQIAAAAEAVGADDFIRLLPDGYLTEVGERGAQLSSGQRQLIAFARALIADPSVLLLDEATSHVDLRTELKIEQALKRLLAGRTAVVIAHRLSTIVEADSIVVIENGRVVEQGSHAELLKARGAYWRLHSDWVSQFSEATVPSTSATL